MVYFYNCENCLHRTSSCFIFLLEIIENSDKNVQNEKHFHIQQEKQSNIGKFQFHKTFGNKQVVVLTLFMILSLSVYCIFITIFILHNICAVKCIMEPYQQKSQKLPVMHKFLGSTFFQHLFQEIRISNK